MNKTYAYTIMRKGEMRFVCILLVVFQPTFAAIAAEKAPAASHDFNVPESELAAPRADLSFSQEANMNTMIKGTLDPASIKAVSDIEKGGSIHIPGIQLPEKTSPHIQAPSRSVMESAVKTVQAKIQIEDATNQKAASVDTANEKTQGFGPHLLTSAEAIRISESARIIIDTAKEAMDSLKVPKEDRRKALEAIPSDFVKSIQGQSRCSYTAGPCVATSQYRTADGSCNNLNKPVWGKSHTPFERFMPSFYEDGVDDPRSLDIFGDPLPGPRTISLNVHTDSDVTTQMPDLGHFSMEFGQFVSHDIQMNALSKGGYNSNLNCCAFPNRRNCFKIDLPTNDPFYSIFNRTCMNFVRALGVTDLDCSVGPRQQMNQNTHYLDGSALYGSTQWVANSLREFSGGRLKSANSGELLPKDTNNAASCILPPNPNVKCFKSGDPRVNQQPALMALTTIWMKEHNRIAARLLQLNPSWTDTKVYNEARKIVGALIQHVTYNEYLPHILGNQEMTNFGLNSLTSGYFTGYDDTVKPQIRNSFSAAAFRFGHSMVQQKMAYNGPGHVNQSPLLHNEFLRPDKLYDVNGGVSSVTRGLYEEFSQKVDRKLTKELTERLFERASGTGNDLAAINIQRGRDHGIASYNLWRSACGLTPADTFTAGVSGGLEHHTPAAALALENVYKNPWDIDLFTGGVSEIPVSQGKVGPTFACIIGLQFKALKVGDRFFYESDTNVKFSPNKLAEIRKATMARIICDNTDINNIPVDVFQKTSPSNPEITCSSLPEIDLTPWEECINGGWSPYRTLGPCYKVRKCDNPKPNHCGNRCLGSPIINTCSIDIKRKLPSKISL